MGKNFSNVAKALMKVVVVAVYKRKSLFGFDEYIKSYTTYSC